MLDIYVYGQTGTIMEMIIKCEFNHFGYSWADKNLVSGDGIMWQTTGDLSGVNTLTLETDTTDTLGGNSCGP